MIIRGSRTGMLYFVPPTVPAVNLQNIPVGEPSGGHRMPLCTTHDSMTMEIHPDRVPSLSEDLERIFLGQRR